MQFSLTPDPLPISTSPSTQSQPSMCVITDLFDITEHDWFASRLDKSPSRTSSLHNSETTPCDEHLQIELLTPDSDTIHTSFNVLTPPSDHSNIPQTLDQFHPSLQLTSSNTPQSPEHQSHHDPIQPRNLAYPNLNSPDTPQSTHTEPREPVSRPSCAHPPSLDQILGTVHPSLLPALSAQAITPPTPVSPAPALSFDDFYTALSTDPTPLPDVHAYLTTLTSPSPPRKPRRKRKLSKRDAARAASAAQLAREQQLAMLANTKQITDDELLRLKPKKQRRAARFDKPVPSRFCHVCSRTPKNVRLVVCCRIKEGVCRKVICEKCFEEYRWGDFEQALNTVSSEWVCPHCSGICPERAQCRTYQRINDRLRVNRLKQETPRNGRRRAKRQFEQKIDSPDEKRPRFLLPAPSEFAPFDTIDQTVGTSSLAAIDIGGADGLE